MIVQSRSNLLGDLSQKGGFDYPLEADSMLTGTIHQLGVNLVMLGKRQRLDGGSFMDTHNVTTYTPASGIHPVTLCRRAQAIVDTSFKNKHPEMTPYEARTRPRFTINPAVDAAANEYFKEAIAPKLSLLQTEGAAMSQLKRGVNLRTSQLFQMPMVDKHQDLAFANIKESAEAARLASSKREFAQMGMDSDKVSQEEGGTAEVNAIRRRMQESGAGIHALFNEQAPIFYDRNLVDGNLEAANAAIHLAERIKLAKNYMDANGGVMRAVDVAAMEAHAQQQQLGDEQKKALAELAANGGKQGSGFRRLLNVVAGNKLKYLSVAATYVGSLLAMSSHNMFNPTRPGGTGMLGFNASNDSGWSQSGQNQSQMLTMNPSGFLGGGANSAEVYSFSRNLMAAAIPGPRQNMQSPLDAYYDNVNDLGNFGPMNQGIVDHHFAGKNNARMRAGPRLINGTQAAEDFINARSYAQTEEESNYDWFQSMRSKINNVGGYFGKKVNAVVNTVARSSRNMYNSGKAIENRFLEPKDQYIAQQHQNIQLFEDFDENIREAGKVIAMDEAQEQLIRDQVIANIPSHNFEDAQPEDIPIAARQVAQVQEEQKQAAADQLYLEQRDHSRAYVDPVGFAVVNLVPGAQAVEQGIENVMGVQGNNTQAAKSLALKSAAGATLIASPTAFFGAVNVGVQTALTAGGMVAGAAMSLTTALVAAMIAAAARRRKTTKNSIASLINLTLAQHGDITEAEVKRRVKLFPEQYAADLESGRALDSDYLFDASNWSARVGARYADQAHPNARGTALFDMARMMELKRQIWYLIQTDQMSGYAATLDAHNRIRSKWDQTRLISEAPVDLWHDYQLSIDHIHELVSHLKSHPEKDGKRELSAMRTKAGMDKLIDANNLPRKMKRDATPVDKRPRGRSSGWRAGVD